MRVPRSDRQSGASAPTNAIVVGAGPNGLTAAVTLARAGVDVTVYEAASTIGGAARTQALTLPGFRHDVCSAVHPLAVGSPAFRSLPLADHGLEWLEPELALAHPLPDGSAVVLRRSVDATAATLGVDASTYRRLVGPFVGRWDELAPDVLRAPLSGWPRHPLLLADFGWRGMLPVAVLARLFRGPRARALVAGLAGHSIGPTWTPATGAIALLFALAAHDVGWRFPRGGAQAITGALASLLRSLGGTIVTDRHVRTLDDLPPARAYLLDVMPAALAMIAGDRLPAGYLRRLRRYRRGPGVFKVDFALDAPVPWEAPECRRASTVHLGPSYREIAAATAAAHRGRPPDPPFLIASEPTVADPSRAPAGRHVLWTYGHVPHGWRGDLTGAVESQIERFAPGFRERVLARASSGPADLEAGNPNLAGGDIAGGAFRGRQTFLRPVVAAVPCATPDPSVYLCSSATPPGPGVHGMCGHHAAQTALARVFGHNAVR